MLYFNFEGYFQYRQATDPDPTDELRGVSGYGFALAGEKDFNRVFDFRRPCGCGSECVHDETHSSGDPVTPVRPQCSANDDLQERWFGPRGTPGPRVGVRVTQVLRTGAEGSAERVEAFEGGFFALEKSTLEERNGVVVRDDLFPIDPVHVKLWDKQGELLLERISELDPDHPGLSILDATSKQIEPRQLQYWQQNSPEVALATGLADPSDETLIRNRDRRRDDLKRLASIVEGRIRDLRPKQDEDLENLRAGLETRIDQLGRTTQWWNIPLRKKGKPGPIDRRAFTLALQAHGWNVALDADPIHNEVHGNGDTPWALQFWMGGWDVDAMCGYIKGMLCVPTRD